MVLIRIMSRKKAKKEIQVDRVELQNVLDNICENINIDSICNWENSNKEKVIFIENVTLMSFEEPVMAKKKPCFLRRIIDCLLRW